MGRVPTERPPALGPSLKTLTACGCHICDPVRGSDKGLPRFWQSGGLDQTVPRSFGDAQSQVWGCTRSQIASCGPGLPNVVTSYKHATLSHRQPHVSTGVPRGHRLMVFIHNSVGHMRSPSLTTMKGHTATQSQMVPKLTEGLNIISVPGTKRRKPSCTIF